MEGFKRSLLALCILSGAALAGCRPGASTPAPMMRSVDPSPSQQSQQSSPVPTSEPNSTKTGGQPAAYVEHASNIGNYTEPEITPSVHDYSVEPGFKNIHNWKKFASGFDEEE